MAEEWLLGQGFHMTEAKDIDTDGQQAGEIEFHGECLMPMKGPGPGWSQSQTPGSSASRSGRKVGVRVDINGFGGGVKSKRYPEGQAISNALNRATGHGEPTAELEDNELDDQTLDNVAPPGGYANVKPGYTKGNQGNPY